jgi:hypothetical protein
MIVRRKNSTGNLPALTFRKVIPPIFILPSPAFRFHHEGRGLFSDGHHFARRVAGVGQRARRVDELPDFVWCSGREWRLRVHLCLDVARNAAAVDRCEYFTGTLAA